MKSFRLFLTEGSIPGEKRGPYQDTKVMITKLSDKDIKKAGSVILKGWSAKGGVNKSAVSSELKRRKDKESGPDETGADEISLNPQEVEKNKQDFFDMKDELENELPDGIEIEDSPEPEITVNNKKEMKWRRKQEKYDKAKEKWEEKKEKYFSIIDPESKLGKMLTSYFEAEPAPFPGLENEVTTMIDALEKYDDWYTGRKVTKYSKKSADAGERAAQAAKDAEEKAQREREKREKREEKRRKKAEKEANKNKNEDYRGIGNTIRDIFFGLDNE